MFFGAAHKALKIATAVGRDVHTVVLDLKGVGLMDTTAMSNLENIANHLARRGTALYLIRVRPALVNKMRRYGLPGNGSPIRLAKGYETVLQNLRSVPAPQSKR